MRIEFKNVVPAAYRAMLGLEEFVHKSGLDPKLLELVKIRASQINGCAYCLDMHTKDARAGGESEQRIYLLDAWKESPFYSERERAALEWTETLTLLPERGAPDEIFDRVRKHFRDEEIVNLTMAIVAINGWNRLEVGFKGDVGDYQPAKRG
jgi:AhpD family alkylhydroperoxidase